MIWFSFVWFGFCITFSGNPLLILLGNVIFFRYFDLGILKLLEVKWEDRDNSVGGRGCAGGSRRELFRKLHCCI